MVLSAQATPPTSAKATATTAAIRRVFIACPLLAWNEPKHEQRPIPATGLPVLLWTNTAPGLIEPFPGAARVAEDTCQLRALRVRPRFPAPAPGCCRWWTGGPARTLLRGKKQRVAAPHQWCRHSFL